MAACSTVPRRRLCRAAGRSGQPAGPSGLGGVASPQVGAGWEMFVRSYKDYTTLLCQVPTTAGPRSRRKQLNDIGSGSVTLNMDAPWWKTATWATAPPPTTILDFECLWQVAQDGVPRFEFLGETVTEQLVDRLRAAPGHRHRPGYRRHAEVGDGRAAGFPTSCSSSTGSGHFGEIDSAAPGCSTPTSGPIVSPSGAASTSPRCRRLLLPGRLRVLAYVL